MKRFIQFLLFGLALLVGTSVSFADAPEKQTPLEYGYNVFDCLDSPNFVVPQLALPPDGYAGIVSRVEHNTPYLLNKKFLSSKSKAERIRKSSRSNI